MKSDIKIVKERKKELNVHQIYSENLTPNNTLYNNKIKKCLKDY